VDPARTRGLRVRGSATARDEHQNCRQDDDRRQKTLRHRAARTSCMWAKLRRREFGSTGPGVLIFDVVRPPGLVAQWESVRLTRGRSLVRNQPGPPPKLQLKQSRLSHGCVPDRRQTMPNVTIWKRCGAAWRVGRRRLLIIHVVVKPRLRYVMRFCCIS
jgi:hypothetical protein